MKLFLRISHFLPLIHCLPTQIPLGNPTTRQAANPFDENYSKIITQGLKDFNVPGISIAVVNGDLTSAYGYGYSSLPYFPAGPDTLYFTGSTSKSFTAASILKLIENSTTLTLETPIADLIDWKLPDEYASAHATLEDALSHRTGMPRHDFSYGGDGFTKEDMVYSLRNLPMTREIRQEWQYCNMMFVVLSVVVEKLSGLGLSDFFKKNIWEPLGMDNTFMSVEEARKKDPSLLATGYFFDNGTKEFVADEYSDPDILSGAGGIISSVNDYAKYLKAVMNEQTILSKKSFQELRTGRSIFDPLGVDVFTGPSSYSLGWMISVYQGVEIFHHTGGVPGFATFMVYIPEKNWAFSSMSNADVGGTVLNYLAGFHLLDNLLDTPKEKRPKVKQIWDFMTSVRLQVLANVRQVAFPSAPPPEKAINHTLSLDSYVGSYYNVGYRYINLTLSSPSTYVGVPVRSENGKILHADVMDRTWPHVLDFEHVNVEHFLVRYHFALNATNFDTETDAMKAEFRIGEDGSVKELGLTYDGQMRGEMIWFEKVG